MRDDVAPGVTPEPTYMPLYEQVLAHAEREYPREACGVFVRLAISDELVYRECANIAPADAARDSFVVAPRDWAAAELEGRIVAVVHSHPDASAAPSDVDRQACHRSGMTWFIVAVPGGVVQRVSPAPLDLVGRTFAHGRVDCYTLVRDYYSRTLGIELPDFERADDWWEHGQNLYRDNFAQHGFVNLGNGMDVQPELHDVVLMAIRSKVPNHAAVYVDQQQILHHLWGRLSGHDVWGGVWARSSTHVLRHRSLLKTTQEPRS
jgi:proteasome lid subunit RPN8/RPN11